MITTVLYYKINCIATLSRLFLYPASKMGGWTVFEKFNKVNQAKPDHSLLAFAWLSNGHTGLLCPGIPKQPRRVLFNYRAGLVTLCSVPPWRNIVLDKSKGSAITWMNYAITIFAIKYSYCVMLLTSIS